MLPFWAPMPDVWLAALAVWALLAGAVSANVEKTIFLGPPARDVRGVDVGSVSSAAAEPAASSLETASLPRLDPDGPNSAWRTFLPAAFPWDLDFGGKATTWVLLDSLQPGRRYEVRVCWAATQPTEFYLETFDAAAVQATPELEASLARFVARQSPAEAIPLPWPSSSSSATSSSSSSSSSVSSPLLLRIVAAADYVSANRSFMHPEGVPAVAADVILDPFVANVLPRSLVPTIGCVGGVALVGVWLARHVLHWLRRVAGDAAGLQSKKII